MREEDNTCHIKGPGCTGRFDALHEALFRSAAGAIVPGSEKAIQQGQIYWRSCNNCNGFASNNHDWAMAHGVKISRFRRYEDADNDEN